MNDLKRQISDGLGAFTGRDLKKASIALLNTLGYCSQKTLELDNAPEAFLEQFDRRDRPLRRDKALFDRWKAVHFLFQITDEEVQAAGSGIGSLFDSSYEPKNPQSYLFLALDLDKGHVTRTQLATIVREINRLFAMPALVLIRQGGALTFAVIDRRFHKRDESRDVLEKVKLIKDIRCKNPHRAHVEILYDLALPVLMERYACRDFTDLHEAWRKTLDTNELNKRFYRELANWYFWALQNVEFPADIEKDEATRNATSVIRLLTRLIFCWFVKEKGLIPDALFSERKLRDILKSLAPGESTYYRAILQNLFFGTLNQRMNAGGEVYRKFANEGSLEKERGEYGVKNIYRYKNLFAVDEAEAVRLFADVPFLNGGLFDCLDKEDERGTVRYLDGFTRNPRKQAVVPNELFFAGYHPIDLSKDYGDDRRRQEPVRGLIPLLDSYKFTVTENTPIEEEIALDPELLGKVFENLLASYNPETGSTARKQTGSFYTPREIVDYMVDEALIADLGGKITGGGKKTDAAEEKLRRLFAYTEEHHGFAPAEVAALVDAVDGLKILDPACGSGAFPMGVLHKLVFILGQLDPGNARWKQKQLDKLDSVSMREELERTFASNDDDYGRKLCLIENCLYGVDIQPIAIQITKLRFFISLICDQRTTQNKAQNCGVRPLPNLETKFVAANTLMAIEFQEEEKGKGTKQILLKDQRLIKLEKERDLVRHRHFGAQRRKDKLDLQKRDRDLRRQIADVLKDGGMNTVASLDLAQWDPYDPNTSAPFFDPEWMFGVKNGFDVVIGNPPYLNVELVSAKEKAYYSEHYQTFYKRYDVYGLFFEASLTRLAGPNGGVTFIVPQQVANNLSYKKLRALILENGWMREVLYLGDKIFQAANNDVCVLFLKKTRNAAIRLVYALDFDHKSTSVVPANYFTQYNNVISFSGDSGGEAVFTKIFAPDRWRIKDRFNVFQGIVTGHNEAFLPTPEQIRVAKIEKALLHPILLGRDFEKWAIRSLERNILYIDGSTDIKLYPNACKWLMPFKPELEQRRECKRGVIPWYSLQWPRVQSELSHVPKILLQRTRNPRLATRIVATIDEEKGIYGMESIIFITPRQATAPIHYLLAVLNSKLINYLYATKFLNVAVKAEYLKDTPIPEAGKKDIQMLTDLVRRILATKAASITADVSKLERQIDEKVYELYGLTDEEIKVVEGAVRA